MPPKRAPAQTASPASPSRAAKAARCEEALAELSANPPAEAAPAAAEPAAAEAAPLPPLFAAGEDPFVAAFGKVPKGKFAKGSRSTYPGVLKTRFRGDGVVVSVQQDAVKTKIRWFQPSGAIYGSGACDWLSAPPFDDAFATRKNPALAPPGGGGGGKTLTPREMDVTEANPTVRNMSNAVVETSLFNQTGADAPALPAVGDRVTFVNGEATFAGRDSPPGLPPFFNVSGFDVVSRPEEREGALAAAMRAPSAVMASLFAAALGGGMVESEGEQDSPVGRQQGALRRAVRAGAAAAAARVRKIAAELQAVWVEAAGGPCDAPDAHAASSLAALEGWAADYSTLARAELCPFATFRDAPGAFRPAHFRQGANVALAVYGITPRRSFCDSMQELLALSGSDPAAAPRTMMIGSRTVDFEISEAAGKIDMSVLVNGVADAAAFVRDGADVRGMLSTRSVAGGPFRLAWKVTGPGKKFVTNYRHRVKLWNEVGRFLDYLVVVKVKPLEFGEGQQEIDAVFAEHFVPDMRSTFAKLPELGFEDVTLVMGGDKVIVPDALAGRDPVPNVDRDGFPVTATTFASCGVLPLQETGASLSSLKKTAEDQGKTLKFAALYPGCFEAAWAEGVDRAAPGAGLRLLTEAAAGLGFTEESSLEHFVAEHGVIYAYTSLCA